MEKLTLLDAVRSAASHSYSILSGEIDHDSAKKKLEQTKSMFDGKFSTQVSGSRDYIPLETTDKAGFTSGKSITDKSGYGVQYTKIFRSGLTVTQRAGMIREYGNAIKDPERTNRGQVIITFLKPVNRDNFYVTADEKAASALSEASEYEYRHTITSTILSAAEAYWAYAAASEKLDIFRDSLKRSQKLSADTAQLVKSGEVPAAELNRLKANEAEINAQLIRAEQSFISTRNSLGLVMALETVDIDRLTLPEDELPLPDPSFKNCSLNCEKLVSKAFANRNDLLAVFRYLEAAEIYAQKAAQDVKPQINLEFSSGYSGLAQGNTTDSYLRALSDNIPGMNFALLLNCSWQDKNRYSINQKEQKDNDVKKLDLRIRDLKRSISISVSDSADSLHSAVLAYEKITAAGSFASKALEGEKEKLVSGLSTFIDLLNTEETLKQIQLSELDSKYAFACALLRLRYVTGTLGFFSSSSHQLEKNDLVTFPVDLIRIHEEQL